VQYRLRGDLWEEQGILQVRVFWARSYFVSTVGLDEEMVKEYI
jgi:hypothetical protein